MWLSPLALARAAISSAWARFAPRGHSQKTCFPALSAAMVISWWKGTRTDTTTMSMSGLWSISR